MRERRHVVARLVHARHELEILEGCGSAWGRSAVVHSAATAERSARTFAFANTLRRRTFSISPLGVETAAPSIASSLCGAESLRRLRSGQLAWNPPDGALRPSPWSAARSGAVHPRRQSRMRVWSRTARCAGRRRAAPTEGGAGRVSAWLRKTWLDADGAPDGGDVLVVVSSLGTFAHCSHTPTVANIKLKQTLKQKEHGRTTTSAVE